MLPLLAPSSKKYVVAPLAPSSDIKAGEQQQSTNTPHDEAGEQQSTNPPDDCRDYCFSHCYPCYLFLNCFRCFKSERATKQNMAKAEAKRAATKQNMAKAEAKRAATVNKKKPDV